MANGNNVDLVGNITRDPELRYTPGGMAVVSFGLAVNHRTRKGDDWEEKAMFFDVSCFGQLAENVAESVSKGARVIVTGRLDFRSWESQDGDRRSKIEVIADEVGPSLRWATAEVAKNDRRQDGAGGGGGGGEQQPRPSRGRSDAPPAYDYDEEPF
jgi:single-strand DNA-binding protein